MVNRFSDYVNSFMHTAHLTLINDSAENNSDRVAEHGKNNNHNKSEKEGSCPKAGSFFFVL
jgi:hypothetical protein